MQEKDLPNWQSFEVELQRLRHELKDSPSQLLFRGLSDSEYRLTTTLDRKGLEGISFSEYYLLTVGRIKSAVETFTGVQWDVPDYSIELASSFHDAELLSLHRYPSVGFYRYMVYLRHNGFPSPLLDWSYSPFVAAFFAFRDATANPKKRSIYVYCEMPEGFKGEWVGAPTIRAIGRYVRSHPRHFRQQSDYTICGKFDPSLGWLYYPHESIFSGADQQNRSGSSISPRLNVWLFYALWTNTT